MSESQNNNPNQGGQGGNNNRRRRHRSHHGGQGSQGGNQGQQGGQNRQASSEGRQDHNHNNNHRNDNRGHQNSNRSRRPGGRVLTANQVLVKYDNLLEQHLITRRKYFEYFNRVDYRQLKKLEYSFYDSVEHLRRFEDSLEAWQRDTLEKRKTERYRLDLTYSLNRGLDPSIPAPIEVAFEDIEDPHYKESQKEAFQEYRDDVEESVGTFEDYLKLKGLT